MRSLIFIVMVALPHLIFPQGKNSASELIAIEMSKQEQAWNKGDIKGFMESYWKSDSLKFIGSSGITYGWQPTIDRYYKSYPTKEKMGLLTFTIIESVPLSEVTHFVVGKWALSKEKPVGGYFTLLWKRINGQWRIVTDHTS